MSSTPVKMTTRFPMIEIALVQVMKSLLKIDCEGSNKLNTQRGFGEADSTLPVAWVLERIHGCDTPRRFTLDAFAGMWFRSFTHDNNTTVDTLKQRLTPWFNKYEVAMALWDAYYDSREDDDWYLGAFDDDM